MNGPSLPVVLSPPPGEPFDVNGLRTEVERDRHYQKASELRLLRRNADSARELLWLTDRYARDQRGTAILSALLGEAGAHSEALRLVRLTFRDALERSGGEQVPPGLWTVAYPTAYLPVIRLHASSRLDPYLAAAIIREEIGPDRKLMVDANQIWDVDEAIDWMKSLAPFDPWWIEEPTSPDDVLDKKVTGRPQRNSGKWRLVGNSEPAGERHEEEVRPTQTGATAP